MRAPALIAGLAVVALAAGGFTWWQARQAARLPEGLAAANGRLEVERADIAAKLAGRIAEIRVREGDRVARDAVIARLDTSEAEAQLASARATVQRALAAIARAEADVAIREAEHALAEVEMRRAVDLMRQAVGSVAEADRRRAQHAVAEANILGARAAVQEARAAHAAAEAQVAQIAAAIADMTLRTPVAGRVEYKLVQVGEVVGAGGRVATILDTSDVFMTVFLPTSEAGRAALGGQARIVLDAAPGYVIPATVSFVAAQAQYTPRTVETRNEREKLMYRVKLSIEPALLERYRDHVKAGLTGNAFVQLDPARPWPAWLAPLLPPVADAGR